MPLDASRRILLFAYYFPPLGMGGTQRLAKWCKYLVRDGWHPTVITVKPVAYYAYDESLLSDLGGFRIIRTGSLDPARLLFRWRGQGAGTAMAGRRTWLSWFFLPDSRVLWLPFAVWAGIRLLLREPHAAVVTSGPPHSSHFAGWVLRRIFRSRWLADFRDSWSGGDFQPEPTALHRRINLALQRFILRRADVVTTISPQLVEELKCHGKSDRPPPELLPNGYDPEDFSDRPQLEERFTVVFCGAITRVTNPRALIEGFRVFVETAVLLPAQARLRFVGADLSGALPSMIRENRLEEFVDITGYVPHAEAVAAMQRASVLAYTAAPGTSAVYVGGKTYEYLAARRPVLAIGEPVEGLRLLRQHAATRACDFGAIDAIARSLLAFYREFRAGALPAASPVPDEFSRRHQARRLVALLFPEAGQIVIE